MKPPEVGQPGRLHGSSGRSKLRSFFHQPGRFSTGKDRNRSGLVDDRLFARGPQRKRNWSGLSYLDDRPDRPEIDDGKVATRLVPDRPGVPEVDGVFIFAPLTGLVPGV